MEVPGIGSGMMFVNEERDVDVQLRLAELDSTVL